MAFGHDSLPSQNWQFGLGDPITNANLVHDQVWLGHQYYNEMVDVYGTKYDETEAKLCEVSPELAGLRDAKLAAADELAEARDEISAENARQRRRTSTEEQRATVRELDRLAKAAKSAYSRCKTATFKIAGVKEALFDIDEKARLDKNARYAVSEAFWGTKLAMQTAVQQIKGVRPNIKHWDGDGRIVLQLDGNTLTGRLLNGTDTRVQLMEMPDDIRESVLAKKRRDRAREEARDSWIKTPLGIPSGTTHLLNFRVGSVGRDPIFATFPLVLHRELPPDAQVRWATIHRHQIGHKRRNSQYRYRWTLTLTLSKPEPWVQPDRATEGVVGVDLGWRRFEGRGLRVAVWQGDDGYGEEVWLPEEMIETEKYLKDLQSTRDLSFNIMRDALADWLQIHRASLPVKMRTYTRYIRLWKSAAKLVKFALWLESKRPYADILPALFEWSRTESHRRQHADRTRQRLTGRRKQIYRNLAAYLRRRYSRVVIENIDWKVLGRKKLPEDTAVAEAIRVYRRLAACGILADTLKNFAAAETIPPEYTTRDCHLCGVRNFVGAQLYCTCVGCNETWDQDVNAAHNILVDGLTPA